MTRGVLPNTTSTSSRPLWRNDNYNNDTNINGCDRPFARDAYVDVDRPIQPLQERVQSCQNYVDFQLFSMEIMNMSRESVDEQWQLQMMFGNADFCRWRDEIVARSLGYMQISDVPEEERQAANELLSSVDVETAVMNDMIDFARPDSDGDSDHGIHNTIPEDEDIDNLRLGLYSENEDGDEDEDEE